MLRQQLRLEQPVGLGRESGTALAVAAPAPAARPSRGGSPGSAAAARRAARCRPARRTSDSSSMSMMPICAVFFASSSCLSSLSIVSSSSLISSAFGHGHRLAAGELVLRGQFVDLVLLAEPLDEQHQLAGEPVAVVAGAEYQSRSRSSSCSSLDGLLERAPRASSGGLSFLAASRKRLAAASCDRVRSRTSPGSSACARRASRSSASMLGPEPGDLAGVEADRRGPVPPRSARAASPYMQHVLERRRHQVRRRLRRAGELRRVVLLVRVDDAAERSRSCWMLPCVTPTHDLVDRSARAAATATMRSVAYRPARTNSTHDGPHGRSLEAFTSNALSHTGGTRFSRSA